MPQLQSSPYLGPSQPIPPRPSQALIPILALQLGINHRQRLTTSSSLPLFFFFLTPVTRSLTLELEVRALAPGA